MASSAKLHLASAMAAFVLVALPAAGQSPTGNSPTDPTPYNWNVFHSGGSDTTNTTASVDPTRSMLQGLPTGLDPSGTFRTEIPSTLLGNFNNGLPQIGTSTGDSVGIINPAKLTDPPALIPWKWNFRQHDSAGDHVLQWLSPFVFNAVPAAITVDNSDAGFTAVGFGNTVTDPATATGNDYVTSTSTADSATWSIAVPAGTTASYYVVVHIPSGVKAAGFNPATTAQYAITYTDPTTGVQTVTVQANQAALGEIVLAGPIPMAGGTTTTVALSDAGLGATEAMIADSAGLVLSNGSPVVADDDNANNVAPQAFTILSGTWTSISGTTTSVAPTAAFGEYKRELAVSAAAVADGSATASKVKWELTPPVTGTYRVSFNIPNSEDASVDETRITDAHYVVQVVDNPGAGETIVSTTDYHVSQTEAANPQPFSKPVTITAATQIVRVTLDNTTSGALSSQTYVVADEALIQSTPNGDAPGGAVAVVGDPTNADPNAATADKHIYPNVYPEIADALYTGVKPGTFSDVDTAQRGNPTVGTMNTDASRRIRMLDYFGRTENGQGTVYCVDGFTGGVVWMYRLPQLDRAQTGETLGDTSVLSTPVVARLNVCTGYTIINPTTAPEVSRQYATKLCVIIADNEGKVYCLDAIGNRDGTGIQPNDGHTTTAGQVGTTTAYWIYRPDPLRPKFADPTDGTNFGKIKTASQRDPNTDLPVPAGFGLSSPTIFIDPGAHAEDLSSTAFGAAASTSLGTDVPATAENSIIYVGSSNGVMYALDATGGLIADEDSTATSGAAKVLTDPYDATLPLSLLPGQTVPTMTTSVKWWYGTGGVSNIGGTQITSAASVNVSTAAHSPAVASWTESPTIYFGASSNDSDTSLGHIYAVDGLTGPAGLLPGQHDYNVSQSPAWAFPNLTTGTALGNISGSPVVYTRPLGGGASETGIYFTANIGPEIPSGQTKPIARSPDAGGRIYKINLSGSFVWSYPSSIDPNSAAYTTTAQTTEPIGSFVATTPAIGVVQYPSNIQFLTAFGSGPTSWTHSDDLHADVKGQSVSMLYAGTSGDDAAMYALDLDAAAAGDDAHRFIYRVPSPNGVGFVSSPALLVNADHAGSGLAAGRGGMVYGEAGNVLYQFSATLMSNVGVDLDATGTRVPESFPVVYVDQFAGFGLLGSGIVPGFAGAGLSGATVTDLNTANAGAANVTEWLFCEDQSTGMIRAMTPRDQNSGVDLTQIMASVPPSVTTTPPPIAAQYPLRTHIFDNSASHSATDLDMTHDNAVGSALPAFDWGSNVYFRISDVVPPNPTDNATLRLVDPGTPSQYITNGSPVTFQLTDVTSGAGGGVSDTGTINIAVASPITSITPQFNGFAQRADTPVSGLDPLVDSANHGYIAAYPYAIRDGTSRANTPGSRRRVMNARQTAELRNTSGALIGTVTLSSQNVAAGATVNQDTGTASTTVGVQQPTFGILNPLAVAGGGVPLTPPASAATTDSSIGPFALYTPTVAGYQALVNGNFCYTTSVPTNGDLNSSSLDPSQPPDSQTVAFPRTYCTVFTATQLIGHGTSGDNNGMLGVADRSQLQTIGMNLSITMDRSALHWWDPNGTAAINALPWDIRPTSWDAGPNTSVDYPDIDRSSVFETLASQDLTTGSAQLTAATYSPESVTVGVNVPRYQPANLTIAPGISNTTKSYASGYKTLVKVYVDSNKNNRWDPNEAYREVYLQSGVPVDLSTQITDGTVDVGQEAQGFGVQTNPTIGAFAPPPAGAAAWSPHFKPLTILNTGNTNLLNVQLDQQDAFQPSGSPFSLQMQGDALDPGAAIPGYDYNAVTGSAGYVVRSSLDADLRGTFRNSLLPAGYAGITFHKPRVGDGVPTTLQLPDTSHDNQPTEPYYMNPATRSKPLVGVMVPIGTPTGSYSADLRAFEGYDYTVPSVTSYLSPPSYGTSARTTGSAPQDWLDITNLGGSLRPFQPVSQPGATLKVTVTEARMTSGLMNGSLPQVDPSGTTTRSNYAPSAFRDVYWTAGGHPAGTSTSIVGSQYLYWTSTRSASSGGLQEDILGAALGFSGNGYVAGGNNQWWSSGLLGGGGAPVGSAGGLINGIGPGTPLPGFMIPPDTITDVSDLTIAREQHYYDAGDDQFLSTGNTYGFFRAYGTASGDQVSVLYAAQIGAGQLTSGVQPGQLATPVAVATLRAPINNVRGLKIYNGTLDGTGSGPAWPGFADPNGGAPIMDDLWAVWSSGARGNTVLSFAGVPTGANGALPGTAWDLGVLPVPASLSQVTDPSAVYLTTRDTAGNPLPVIEVTYSGVAPGRPANIYVSRYRPYHPIPAGTTTPSSAVAMALVQTSLLSENLQPDAARHWWYARDVGWVRNKVNTIDVRINGASILAASPAPTFDTATGQLVFTGASFNGVTYSVYVDLGGGRVRFTPALPASVPASPVSVSAVFSAYARRISTDTLPDSQPVSLIDEAFVWNGYDNPTPTAPSGFLAAPPYRRVSAARAWYLWRKASPAGVAAAPTVWYKTQRLMIKLTNASGPIGIALVNGHPDVTVRVTGGGPTIYDGSSGGNGGSVEVDWKRGWLSFPLTIAHWADGTPAGVASEGLVVDISGHDSAGGSITASGQIVQWQDETQTNDTSGTPGSSAAGAQDLGQVLLPMQTAKNETLPWAFLDPQAYANVEKAVYPFPNGSTIVQEEPHKLWVYWTSTRNAGTAGAQTDLYYETIAPTFQATSSP